MMEPPFLGTIVKSSFVSVWPIFEGPIVQKYRSWAQLFTILSVWAAETSLAKRRLRASVKVAGCMVVME
jgi:hypothetical protein